MTKLSQEERSQREREAQVFDETIDEVRQFSKLRARFPDLPDSEIAHRMVAPVKQVRKLKKLLERGV